MVAKKRRSIRFSSVEIEQWKAKIEAKQLSPTDNCFPQQFIYFLSFWRLNSDRRHSFLKITIITYARKKWKNSTISPYNVNGCNSWFICCFAMNTFSAFDSLDNFLCQSSLTKVIFSRHFSVFITLFFDNFVGRKFVMNFWLSGKVPSVNQFSFAR